jgi:hypothetical protein
MGLSMKSVSEVAQTAIQLWRDFVHANIGKDVVKDRYTTQVNTIQPT